MISPNRLLAVLDSRIGWWQDADEITHIVYEWEGTCGCVGGYMLDDRDFAWTFFLAEVCAWHGAVSG